MDAKEQLEALGHDPDAVDGELKDNPAPEKVEEKPSLDSVEEESRQDEPSLDSEDEEVQDGDESQTEDDPNDKTWQSKYDKTLTEKERIAQEKERIEAEKQALLAMLQSMGGNTAPNQSKSDNKKPELWDFIKQDEFYESEALNPATVSGQAYQNWQESLADWRAEQSLAKFEQKQQAKQQETLARQQANVLAEKYPEFRNPLTGQPNMQKIAQFMDEINKSSDVNLWADLYELTKTKKTPQPKQDLSAIGRKANKVSSVASQSSSEKENKPVPKTIKQYAGVFGTNFEVPVEAELE